MSDYVFTTSAGTSLNINTLKFSLAARNSSLTKLLDSRRVRAVNMNTLPTSPSRGFAALLGASPASPFTAYAGHLAIHTPADNDNSWLFVRPSALGNVAQDFRAAQYAYNGTTWVETITDSSAEGIGVAGPRGPSGPSSNVSKLALDASFTGAFGSGRWLSHGRIESAVDDGEQIANMLPSSIYVGFPVVHIVPATGAPYYQILRATEIAGTSSPGTRQSRTNLFTNRDGGVPIQAGDRLRFVGICVTNRVVTTAAQNTNVMSFRLSRHITIRQDEMYVVGLSGAANLGPIHNGLLLYFTISGNTVGQFPLLFSSMGFSTTGTLFSRRNGYSVPIPGTSPRPTQNSSRTRGGGPTNYITFQESDEYFTIPNSL